MPDDHEIARQLDRIVKALPEPEPQLIGTPGVSAPEFQALVAALAASGEFGEFDDSRLQALGQGATAVTLAGLAGWMVGRASSVGGEQALQEVRDYLDRDEFPASAVMLLTGLRPDEEFDLGEGVRLVPAAALPTERLRRAALAEMFSGLPLPEPTGGLVCEFTQPRRHYAQEEKPGHREFTSLPFRRLEDGRLSLTMSRPGGHGVQGIATAAVAGDHLPMLCGTGWHTHEYVPVHPTAPFIGVEAQRARAFHETLLGLAESHRMRLCAPERDLVRRRP